MKKLVFTHLFLNLYLLALIQPSLPIIEYLINYNYIVEELCENKDKPILACNGKCYLEKQVTKQQNLDHKNEAPQPPKVDFEKFFTLKYIPFTYHIVVNEQFQKNPLFYIKLEDQKFVDSILRPPIV